MMARVFVCLFKAVSQCLEEPQMQFGAKVGLQLWVHKTQNLSLYYYLLIIVLSSTQL